MRIAPIVVALAVLALAVTALAQDAPNGWTLAFTDDFSRTDLGMNWLVMRGDWRIADGRLVITRPWSSDSAVRTVQPLRENVRLECDVCLTHPGYVKAAVRIGDQFWDGGGAMRAGRGARGGETQGEVVLASPGLKGTQPDAEIEPGKWVHVAVEYSDGRHRAWLGDKLIKDEKIVLSGRFNDYCALFAIRDAEWDNVNVFTKPYAKGFAPDPVATPETNRRATVDAAKFFDAAKPDCGFQEAIDSLPATGGAVILPAGEFVMHTALFLGDGVALRGQGRATKLMLPSPIVWSKLAADAKAGDTKIVLDDASAFKPGWMLSLGVSGMYYLRADTPWRVAKVEGNALTLNKPLAGALRKGAPVGNWFPVIYGSNGADMEVRDLAIDGRAADPAPFSGGYGASAVTFFFVRNVRVVNVHVNGWKGDAFSFQGGRDNLCAGCSVVGAAGHGYHPGSCQRRTIIADCLADRCGGDGYYFCRYNQESVIRGNVFTNNGGCMIGGLAVAGDQYNAITANYGAGNGQGVPFDGGANDVFFGNTLIDSGDTAMVPISGGVYTGVLTHRLHTYAGPSRYHVIVGNRFADRRRRTEAIGGIVGQPGASAIVVADNTFDGVPSPTMAGPADITAANVAGKVDAAAPTLPTRPPLPKPIIDAAKYYDPAKPDCGFQAAIDALGDTGGTVRLPAGVYDIRQMLSIPSRVMLCGEGMATVLVHRASPTLIRSRRTTGAAIARLTLRAPEGAMPDQGIALLDAERPLVSEVDVLGMKEGLAVEGGAGLRVERCRFRRSMAAVTLHRSSNATLAGNQLLQNSLVAVEATDTADLVFQGNIIWSSRRQALSLNDVRVATLSGNVLTTSGAEALHLRRCQQVSVTGNVVHNSSLRGKGRHAGMLLANSHDCRVIANRIGDDLYDPFQTTAIAEDAKSDANVIMYNVCCPENRPRTGALDKAIVTHGKQTVARDNVLAPYPPKETK